MWTNLHPISRWCRLLKKKSYNKAKINSFFFFFYYFIYLFTNTVDSKWLCVTFLYTYYNIRYHLFHCQNSNCIKYNKKGTTYQDGFITSFQITWISYMVTGIWCVVPSAKLFTMVNILSWICCRSKFSYTPRFSSILNGIKIIEIGVYSEFFAICFLSSMFIHFKQTILAKVIKKFRNSTDKFTH